MDCLIFNQFSIESVSFKSSATNHACFLFFSIQKSMCVLNILISSEQEREEEKSANSHIEYNNAVWGHLTKRIWDKIESKKSKNKFEKTKETITTTPVRLKKKILATPYCNRSELKSNMRAYLFIRYDIWFTSIYDRFFPILKIFCSSRFDKC